jgi:hypothetical protein
MPGTLLARKSMCLSIPPMEARGSRFNVPAIAFVKGSDRSVFTDSQRRCVSAIRSLASAMPPGTLNLMSVMRLPPIGSSALRMLTDCSVRGSVNACRRVGHAPALA